jgi:phage terminase large subunit-like protein
MVCWCRKLPRNLCGHRLAGAANRSCAAQGNSGHQRAGKIAYDQWRDEGWLETTPGPTVSYEFVAHRLREMFERHRVRKISDDRWNMKHLTPWLRNAGFSEQSIKEHFVAFGQGYQSMSPALRDLAAVILEKSCVMVVIRCYNCVPAMPSSSAMPQATGSFPRSARPAGSME